MKKSLFSTLRSESGVALVIVLFMVSLLAVIGITLNRTGGLQSTISFNLKAGEEAYYIANAGVKHALFKLKRDPYLRGVVFSEEPFSTGSYRVSVTDEITPMGTVLISSQGSAGAARRTVEKRVNPDGVFTVYPPLIKDAYFLSGMDENYGVSSEVKIGTLDAPARAVFEYDLSMIPDTATINSATFEIFMYKAERIIIDSDNHNDVKIHRMTRSWNEGIKDGMLCESGATWDTVDCINPWTVQGGDFDAGDEASLNINFIDINRWHQFDVKNLIKEWVQGTYLNYGMLLQDKDEEGNNKRFLGYFYSDEYSDEDLRPKLTVVYTTN